MSERNKTSRKCVEKLKGLFITDKRGYFRRLLISAPVCLAICFTFLFFGPFELVAHSGNSLYYSYKDVGPLLAMTAGIVFAVITPIVPLFRGKLFNYIVSVSFSVTLAAYLQAMFFNGSFGELTGDPIDWTMHKTELVANLAIWIGILLVVLFIMYLKRAVWRGVTTVLAIVIVLSQTVPLIGILNGAYGEKTETKKDNFYLSCDGMFNYSKNKNIFLFVLDRLDYDYIDLVRDSYPDFFDKLDGFTDYTNAISTYARTLPAASHMLTGYEENAYEIPDDKYYEEAWTMDGKNILEDLNDSGYRVDIYTEMSIMFNDGAFANKYVENVDYDKVTVPKETLLGKMINLSCFRYSPIGFKPFFYTDTNYYNAGAEIEEVTPERELYFIDESKYVEQFKDITAGEEVNCFKYYHFNGPHAPFYMREDGTRSETPTSSLKQTVGSFNILFGIFDQMKELGIYEDATIIITADHGSAMSDLKPLIKATRIGMFYKPSGSAGTPLAESSAPISTMNIPATILKAAGADYSAYGRPIDEIGEDEDIVRTYYKTAIGSPSYVYTYEVRGDASVFENWVIVDKQELKNSYN